MLVIKTKEEKIREKAEMLRARDEKILTRFREFCKEYSTSDAVAITASEFNLSQATIYNIRKRNA